MMDVKITSPSLPGGWDCYCGGCDMFFSVLQDQRKDVKHCPVCGGEAVIKSPEDFDAAYPGCRFRRAS